MKTLSNRNIYLALILSYLIVATSSCSDRTKDFVDTYQNENFEDFRNLDVSIEKMEGKMLVIHILPISHSKIKGPYIVTFDPGSKRIVKENKSPEFSGTGKLQVNKGMVETLIKRFHTYRIQRLSVDDNINVFVSLKHNGQHDLVRFSDSQFKSTDYDTWKPVKGMWFSVE